MAQGRTMRIEPVGLVRPTLDELMSCQTDIHDVDVVQIRLNKREGKLWVNVNGICLLRLIRIKTLEVEQEP